MLNLLKFKILKYYTKLLYIYIGTLKFKNYMIKIPSISLQLLPIFGNFIMVIIENMNKRKVTLFNPLMPETFMPSNFEI